MGKIICAGLGPGDPDLISVRAHRILRSARHVAFFRKAGRQGQARRIVQGLIPDDAIEYPMEYPVTTEIPFDSPEYNDLLASFYDSWASRLETMAADRDIIVPCEGDPFFYGSFMHLYVRLRDKVEIEVIPGIPGMAGCWNATGTPVTWGDDVMSVLMGTLPRADLVRHMQVANALVIMKTGRNLPKIRQALALAGRLEDAWLIERGTMPGERVVRLQEVEDHDCPYFAIVMVHGQGRRPERRIPEAAQ
ncbi:precorrin-2 C(20)-methyltransferase [Paracoccus sp. Z330]|uniref:Precorrin-2 C(20)-methyltransferase n=1 Tax=Paracoccus onchidii TaxID=3017813 RepID=A0ABT4ZDT2_9RHOB|nr:precorrin-2 C(20)-methyltransferase [Paracoccus onchidii]MDB6177143.1 precorrin-2 C(20)-methyltransferase [Paracoccus onchidii]